MPAVLLLRGNVLPPVASPPDVASADAEAPPLDELLEPLLVLDPLLDLDPLLGLEPLLDLAVLLPPEREELDDLGFAVLFALLSSLHRMQYHLEGALVSPMQGRWYQLLDLGTWGCHMQSSPRTNPACKYSIFRRQHRSSRVIGRRNFGVSRCVNTRAGDFCSCSCIVART